MKIPAIIVPLLLAAATFSTSARAQIFSTYQSATTDSDVYNGGVGATALAFDFDDQFNNSTTNVNGVTFTGNKTNSGTGVSLSATNLPNTITNGVQASGLAAGATSNYAFVLNGAAYNYGTTGTLTFSGLTAGATYELQVFGGSTAVDYTETLTDATTIPGPLSPSGTLPIGPSTGPSNASFINENFVAPLSGTETVSVSDTSYIIVDAVNLQETSVPEPSTYAMMFGAVGLLALMLRFRGLSA